MTKAKRVLLVASIGADALLLMRLKQQLCAMLHPPVVVEAVMVAHNDTLLASAMVTLAEGYDAAYHVSPEGVFHLRERESAATKAFAETAKTKLAELSKHILQRSGAEAEKRVTLIARGERIHELLDEAARAEPHAHIDACMLASRKNEWIEAGYVAAVLAGEPGCAQELLVLPGKNYQLEDDAELFCAVLHHGVVVKSSDLRAFYALRGAIDFARANFTARQLQDVATLPAPLTALYVRGDGSMVLSSPYATLSAQLGGDALHVRCGVRFFTAWQAPREGLRLAQAGGYALLALPQGNAWEWLGSPQPGDELKLSNDEIFEHVALEAA